MEGLREILKEMEERLTNKINSNTDLKFDELQKEIKGIKSTNVEQDQRLDLLERQIRQKNIMFFGVPEGERSYEELESTILGILKQWIQLDYSDRDIVRIVRRIGRKKQDVVRPICVTFLTFGLKLKILKAKNNFERSGIYIKEDFPPKVMEKRKILQEQLVKERNEGKNAILKYDKIIILNNKPETNTKHNSNAKKRALHVSPPKQIEASSSSSKEKQTTSRPDIQASKKNKTNSMHHYLKSSNSDTESTSNQQNKL